MEIRYTIAQGHVRKEITPLLEKNPDLTPAGAAVFWAEGKFTAWATRNNHGTVSVAPVDATAVQVTLSDAAGAVFLREVGGREIG